MQFDLNKNYILSLGFDDVRVANARGGTPYASQFLESIRSGLHGPLDYLENTAKERSDVLSLMPEAQSVVVVVKNYFPGHHEEPKEKHAKISRYAWGGDYHHWFKKRLRKVRQKFEADYGTQTKVHIFNDISPVSERGWANRSGLGFIGKSGMFIHRKFGTWTFLGGLVTDIPFKPDKPFPKQMCGTCTACIDACPTQAIIAPQKVDAKRCLTTWNVEKPLSKEADADHLKNHGWALGCDICQEVCPWNKFEKLTNEPRFLKRTGRDQVFSGQDMGDLRGTPFARAGTKGLEKSVQRALGLKSDKS